MNTNEHSNLFVYMLTYIKNKDLLIQTQDRISYTNVFSFLSFFLSSSKMQIWWCRFPKQSMVMAMYCTLKTFTFIWVAFNLVSICFFFHLYHYILFFDLFLNMPKSFDLYLLHIGLPITLFRRSLKFYYCYRWYLLRIRSNVTFSVKLSIGKQK